MFGQIGVFECLLVSLVGIIILVPACRLAVRIGYPAWAGLLILAPVANLIALYYVAFGKWSAEPERTKHPF